MIMAALHTVNHNILSPTTDQIWVGIRCGDLPPNITAPPVPFALADEVNE